MVLTDDERYEYWLEDQMDKHGDYREGICVEELEEELNKEFPNAKFTIEWSDDNEWYVSYLYNDDDVCQAIADYLWETWGIEGDDCSSDLFKGYSVKEN